MRCLPVKSPELSVTAKFKYPPSFNHTAVHAKRRHVTPELATNAVPETGEPGVCITDGCEWEAIMLVGTRDGLAAKNA
jgi:hypothetical protein